MRREIKNNGWKNAKEREERLIGGRQFGLELSAVALFMMLEIITVPLLIPVEALGTAAEDYCDRNGAKIAGCGRLALAAVAKSAYMRERGIPVLDLRGAA